MDNKRRWVLVWEQIQNSQRGYHLGVIQGLSGQSSSGLKAFLFSHNCVTIYNIKEATGCPGGNSRFSWSPKEWPYGYLSPPRYHLLAFISLLRRKKILAYGFYKKS
jgi:hypothetical protein